ncbi:hypothetical protein EW145_g7385 [Phellinidium pouzarii]|uniref:Uncharacterized protein n=1 Tax=Phellinidium pouzarii TaxID=167371 RepID=A0A4S4KKE0_9AGAM|nr:hypothetical protein EW145_g7385 [Phellinidium pouzarii]
MPNGVGVGMPGQGPGPGVGVGSPGYLQSAGSRAATPAQGGGGAGGLTHPSPSLPNRQVPQTPPSFGGMSVPTGGGRGPPFDQMNTDIAKIDPQTMSELKAELGLGNKDPTMMSFDEKTRLLNTYKSRQQAGPSNQAGPNARNQQGRGSKRNSVSPPDEVMTQHQEIPTKGESSPPAQKRVRRSPESSAPPNAQGPPGSQTPMAGLYPPSMMPPAIRSGPSFTPQMSHMSPGMMMQQGMVTAPQQMTQQFQPKSNQQQYMMHKMGAGDPQTFAPDVNQPRSAPPVFAPGGAGNVGNRPGQQQNKPSGNMMPPPSSPATNGAGKPPSQQQGVQGKSDGTAKTESSPRSGQQQQPPSVSAGAAPSPATSTSGQAGGGAGAPSRPSTASSITPVSSTAAAPPASAEAASSVAASVSASVQPTSGGSADPAKRGF